MLKSAPKYPSRNVLRLIHKEKLEMIECKFVWQAANGASSDSLVNTYKVHAVPSVGDRLTLIGTNGNATDSVVKSVTHDIETESGSHWITVYYGDR